MTPLAEALRAVLPASVDPTDDYAAKTGPADPPRCPDGFVFENATDAFGVRGTYLPFDATGTHMQRCSGAKYSNGRGTYVVFDDRRWKWGGAGMACPFVLTGYSLWSGGGGPADAVELFEVLPGPSDASSKPVGHPVRLRCATAEEPQPLAMQLVGAGVAATAACCACFACLSRRSRPVRKWEPVETPLPMSTAPALRMVGRGAAIDIVRMPSFMRLNSKRE